VIGTAVAREPTPQMDNGSQYLSDHFQNQIKFWGHSKSFESVSQPQTSAVAQRFNKTLKEQVTHIPKH
jgi:putative transposase